LNVDLNAFGNFFFDLKNELISVAEAEVKLQENLDALYPAAEQVVSFIKQHSIQVLNVAGNRELKKFMHRPFVTATTRLILMEAFSDLSDAELLLADSAIF
jgi:calcineurin-like phosphoesterase